MKRKHYILISPWKQDPLTVPTKFTAECNICIHDGSFYVSHGLGHGKIFGQSFSLAVLVGVFLDEMYLGVGRWSKVDCPP